ncbi:hypothetical protein CLOM_g20435 [Closterium sp. NIES-68]|nr:hypothetical protein CLOM_g20435 [Closterium sp. NIES-68]
MAESLSAVVSPIASRQSAPVCRPSSPRTRPRLSRLSSALRFDPPLTAVSPRLLPLKIFSRGPRASRAFPRPPSAFPVDSVPCAAATPQAQRAWRKLWAQLAEELGMRKRRRWRWGVLDWYLARSMAGPFAVAAGVAASVGVALGSLAEVARVAANTGAPLRLALLVALHTSRASSRSPSPPPASLPPSSPSHASLRTTSWRPWRQVGLRGADCCARPVCVGVAAGALMLACHEHVIPWAMGRAQRMVEAAVTSDMASLPSQEHVLLREYGAHAQQHHDPLALLLTHLHPSSPLPTHCGNCVLCSPSAGGPGRASRLRTPLLIAPRLARGPAALPPPATCSASAPGTSRHSWRGCSGRVHRGGRRGCLGAGEGVGGAAAGARAEERVREQRRRVAEAESDLVLRDASCASCAAYAVLGAVAVLVTAAPATATSTISTSISSIVRSSGGGQRGGSSGQPFQVGLVLAAAFHLLSAALAAAARSALLPRSWQPACPPCWRCCCPAAAGAAQRQRRGMGKGGWGRGRCREHAGWGGGAVRRSEAQ